MSLSYRHMWLQQMLEENLHRLHHLFPGPGPPLGLSRLARGEFVDVDAGEARADLTVLYGDPAVECLIIEIQFRSDPQKPDAWMRYIQQAIRQYGCPVRLLVLTVGSPRLREWALTSFNERSSLALPPLFIGRQQLAAPSPVLLSTLSISDALMLAAFHQGTTTAHKLITYAWL